MKLNLRYIVVDWRIFRPEEFYSGKCSFLLAESNEYNGVLCVKIILNKDQKD
jgi:hypothetical protein